MASSGQTTPQAPQLMQSSGSMTWRSLRSPVMASVGQRLMHAVQPVQFSVMMKGIGGDPFGGDARLPQGSCERLSQIVPQGHLQRAARGRPARAKLFREL